jgi:phosphotriesterase-related protein
MSKIRTVIGDISPSDFGLALVHEHVICDFIGAGKVSRDRYDSKEVFDVMLPYLKEIGQLGVTGFVDCTPAFIGRDAQLLANLTRATDIHILTNTGLYKEPFLPNYAFENSIDQLADMWTHEIEEGIEELPIKAGFIKIAVNPGHIIPIQEKIVRAAGRCSLSTNASIACHTSSGVAAIDLLKILVEEGVDPSRVVVVHCDAEEDWKYHLEILEQGAWVEYDAISDANSEKTLRLINNVAENDFDMQLLLSQDAGWYNVGEKQGGNIRSYAYLVKGFVPLMIKSGFSRNFINKVLIENPATAFQIDS